MLIPRQRASRIRILDCQKLEIMKTAGETFSSFSFGRSVHKKCSEDDQVGESSSLEGGICWVVRCESSILSHLDGAAEASPASCFVVTLCIIVL